MLVRRLDAIENLGSMDLLCTDKTGTLTVGAPQLHEAIGPDGAPSAAVLEAAAANAHLQTGLPSPLDECLAAACALPTGTVKLGELPYDFVRKRLSVAVRLRGEDRLITKGAVPQVLAACALDARERERLAATLGRHADEGLRVIAVADRPLGDDPGRALRRTSGGCATSARCCSRIRPRPTRPPPSPSSGRWAWR